MNVIIMNNGMAALFIHEIKRGRTRQHMLSFLLSIMYIKKIWGKTVGPFYSEPIIKLIKLGFSSTPLISYPPLSLSLSLPCSNRIMNQGKVLFRNRPLLFGKLHGRHYTKPTVLKRVVRGTGIVTLATTLTLGVGGTIMYNTNDQFRHVMNALDRCRLAGVAGTMVALDYQKTLTKQYNTEQEYDEAKKKCHLRCANRVLDAIQRLGGVYVKLGQHISVMQYLLPPEWCVTMSVLQDRCDPTEPEAIRALFESDYVGVDELFDEFDWTPLGVASLAQVHKARLKGSDQWVAVKLQHPNLDEYCQLDMDTVSFILEIVKRVFPDFGFQWFADEIRESIPKELDFVHETMNSRRVYSNFEKEIRNHKTSLVIPEVIWAKRRIMCMECKYQLGERWCMFIYRTSSYSRHSC
jgi:aarF domain-containing kinase